MAPKDRFPGWGFSSLLGALVLGLAACGEKPAPEPTSTPIPPVTQPQPKQPEMKVAEPQQAPAVAAASTDAELAARVKDAIGAEGSVNVHRIDVNAENGAVTLYGTAETADQRARAAQIAAGVAGVKSVQNKLAIVAGS